MPLGGVIRTCWSQEGTWLIAGIATKSLFSLFGCLPVWSLHQRLFVSSQYLKEIQFLLARNLGCVDTCVCVRHRHVCRWFTLNLALNTVLIQKQFFCTGKNGKGNIYSYPPYRDMLKRSKRLSPSFFQCLFLPFLLSLPFTSHHCGTFTHSGAFKAYLGVLNSSHHCYRLSFITLLYFLDYCGGRQKYTVYPIYIHKHTHCILKHSYVNEQSVTV